jgi:hypothetical protein
VPMAPAASATPAPTTGGSQPEMTPGKFKSQAQKFNPRETKPMSSASPSTSSPNAASTPTISPGGKLTKQEKKEQKREEKKEFRQERKEAAQQGEVASPSPSTTP